MPRARVVKWILGYVILIGILGTTMESVEGRPIASKTDYANISFNELISTYKQAYIESGFRFVKQTTHKEQASGGRSVTRLAFEFAMPEFPKKKKGVASFVIVSPDLANQECAPCSVYPETLGGEASDYSSEEYAIFIQKINSAANKANSQIEATLGKGVRPTAKLPPSPKKVD